MLDAHGVEVHIDSDHSVGLTLEAGVDVVASVDDVVDRDLRAELIGLVGEPC